jgi:Cytochrome c oxidase assembly protein CtaG/Cox11
MTQFPDTFLLRCRHEDGNIRAMLLRHKALTIPLAAVLVAIPGFYLYMARSVAPRSDIVKAVESYVKAVYARDFREAYGWLSPEDRHRKDQQTYVKEQGAFTGFTLKLATKLASFIEITPAQPFSPDDPVKVKFELKLPDVVKLGPTLMQWDEEKLNSLSVTDQDALMKNIEEWHNAGRIPFTRVEENFVLVRENEDWRIFLNLRRDVNVDIRADLPDGVPLQVEPTPREITFRPGEPFTVTLKLKNNSSRELRARVAHNIEPQVLEKYLGLGTCGAFVPFRLAAGQEKEDSSTFLVWTDIPAETERFTMIYQFEVDKH